MAYGSMAAVNLIMQGVIPAVYSLEMITGGKNFEEATGEIQDFFRSFNKSVIEYVPETIYGILSIPDTLCALGKAFQRTVSGIP